MLFNGLSSNVIHLCYSSAGNLLLYAPHWMVTGFMEDGRVRGLLPSDEQYLLFLIR